MLAQFAALLKSQAEALTAQTKVVSLQSLPPLPMYTGENRDITDDSFELWSEKIQERASVSGWSEEQKLYQLKLHLDKTAAEVFRVLPGEEKNSFKMAMESMKKRFQPVDIEELRGLQFHHKMQGEESVEQLGISLQQLGRKAFPSMTGKELDRLLKGRFFQALHVKWQRKLGVPKPDETFYALYDRARMFESREKQYSADSRVDNRGKQKGQHQNRSSEKQFQGDSKSDSGSQSVSVPRGRGAQGGAGVNRSRFRRQCYNCHGYGHYASDCTRTLREAPGRARGNPASSTNSTVGAEQSSNVSVEPSSNVSIEQSSEMTTEQLEQMLAQRRLEQENSSMSSTSSNNAVKANSRVNGAVGEALYINLEVDGVSVEAMVDTGAQSTIISRSLLCKIAQHRSQNSQPLPKLELPSVHLYGKDGEKKRRQLVVTAQVAMTISVDQHSVIVPVFVQPDSAQECLLGMNAIPFLGFVMTRSNGETLWSPPNSTSEESEAYVNLVSSVTIPGFKGSYAVGKVNGEIRSEEVLFEPCHSTFNDLGVDVQEALLSVGSDGSVTVPVSNFQGMSVKLEDNIIIGKVVKLSSLKGLEKDSVGSINEVRADPTAEKGDRLESIWEEVRENMGECNEPDAVKKLLGDFVDCFALNDSELGCTDVVQHHIDTGQHSPIKQPPYRTPMSQRQRIATMVEAMQQQSVVQPSVSPWASPVVLVPKKDGSLRFCVDYRKLNSVTKKDVYPLPRIDDILDALGGMKYFSSLDLASGYWQVALDPSTRSKTAFATHCGLFEFVRMPFGLCNAPATFQRVMQHVLAGMEWNDCFVYLDDILIVSKDLEEHLEHLREVFERLRRAGLKLKPKKCHLLQESVHFLGHVISKDGIRPDPAKTRKVEEFPVPTDVTTLRQFLGLSSYYRRFIPEYAKVASPLHKLTRKDSTFEWSEECDKAFNKLKKLLTSAPVLVYPKFDGRGFIMATDASYSGLGAVLSQLQDDGTIHPIAYASRSLNQHERNYGISELETLGLVWAVRHFRPYLLGYPCVVYTDHLACLSILNSSKPSGKLARWALIVQEFDLTLKHKPGKSNTDADALSRNPVPDVEIAAVCADAEYGWSSVLSARTLEMRDKQQEDEELALMIDYLCDGKIPEDEVVARKVVLQSSRYEVLDGILQFENPTNPGQLCVVVPKSLQQEFMEEAHCSCFGGHLSERKVYSRLRRYVWWRGMRKDIRTFCRGCLVCASRKGTRQTFKPPLQSIPVGGPFHRVGVDVLQLPLTVHGNKYVLVFMDYFTKWVEAFPMSDQKTITIATLFVEHIICRHGIPEQLISDRGTNFLSELISGICEVLGVKKLNTSGYHPQTDGLVEKFNSTLINMVAKCCETRQHDWDDHLPQLLFAYRSVVQESTKESPFFLLYGRDPRIPSSTVLSQTRSVYSIDTADYRTELMVSLAEAWQLAKSNIGHAQCRQKKSYDKDKQESNLKPGERVMVYMPSESQGPERKLARPFHGPYRVLGVTPANAEVVLVDRPEDECIFVALSRVRRCYAEQGNEVWAGGKGRARRRRRQRVGTTQDEQPTRQRDDCPTQPPSSSYTGPVTRQRSRRMNK